VLVVALLAYYETRHSLPNLPRWWDVAFLALVLMPAVFALVGLTLPLRRRPGLFLVAIALGVFAAASHVAGFEVAANFAKLGAVTLLAWWFLTVFEEVSWVVIVACVIPWVDAYSVWRGPTKHIVTERRDIFRNLSVSFPTPGEHAASHLGLPDVLFFALFLAAAVRFGLRPFWTWLAMTLSFGLTIALAVWFGLDGLPALPALSVGFLLPNADLLWRALRRQASDAVTEP
jgi:hypothetical protein